MAIDDAMDNKFDAQIYENEINTLKNRGFTDGYLVHRPYERTDTQNHVSSLEEGTHQVNAISEDGEFFKCKYKIFPGNSYEIVAPTGSVIEDSENEISKVYSQEGKKFINFKQLITKKGKVMSEIHSGNENEINLGVKLPKFSFLREKI